MEVKDKFEEVTGYRFVEDPRNVDVEIGTWNTADGYSVYVITQDPNNLYWENEVYYNQPSYDDIMSYLDDIRVGDDELVVYCDDFHDYFDEYYMLDYLQENMDEDEFDKFANEVQ